MTDGIFNGMASNGSVLSGTEPLKLAKLMEMNDAMKQFTEPLKYQQGADMSGETWNALRAELAPIVYKPHSAGTTTCVPDFIGIDVHIRPNIPFGEVRECSCGERE